MNSSNENYTYWIEQSEGRTLAGFRSDSEEFGKVWLLSISKIKYELASV
ncbi:hypothetical protein [Escherichia coli]|nr:hypothetical protein [Escherichia coli]